MSKTLETGLSSCGKQLDRPTFAAYQAAGIRYMEISPQMEEYASLNYPEMRRLAEEYGVCLWSYHLPFMPFEDLDLAALDRDKRRRTLTYCQELIKKAADIGVDKFVVHASGEPNADKDRPDAVRAAMESLASLAETAAHAGGVMALEDLPRTCIGNTGEEVNLLLTADERLRVCFDTNHLLQESPEDFVRTVGDKIITLHVSDYDFVDEKHWMPGEGQVDWDAVITALEQVGYTGPWMYEISPSSPRMPRSRELTCEDFVRNTRELFARAPLTIVK